MSWIQFVLLGTWIILAIHLLVVTEIQKIREDLRKIKQDLGIK